MSGKGKRDGLIPYRVELLETAVKEIAESLKGIERTLATYTETKATLDRAFGEMKELETKLEAADARVGRIEKAMPLLQLTSTWIKTGVTGVLALVGLAIWKLLTK